MEYSYKFRIYPTAVQAEQIQKTFGCCRFVWNHYLVWRGVQLWRGLLRLALRRRGD